MRPSARFRPGLSNDATNYTFSLAHSPNLGETEDDEATTHLSSSIVYLGLVTAAALRGAAALAAAGAAFLGAGDSSITSTSSSLPSLCSSK